MSCALSLRRLTMLVAALILLMSSGRPAARAAEPPRWNILFVFVDDWGRYASCYRGLDGRPGINDVVSTPAIDRLAREGAVFRHAFVNAPSCTPCRSSLFSGRSFFNCGRGAILHNATWDESIPTFPLLLKASGYTIGKSFKIWSPGSPGDAPYGRQAHAFQAAGGRHNDFSESVTTLLREGRTLADAQAAMVAEVRGNFDAFLAARTKSAPQSPWLYTFGCTTTHRAWVKGSGKTLWGIDPDTLRGRLPAFLPDVPEVREDVADYLGEVQAVDAYVAALVARLEEAGELDRTLIVLSGDHGMPGVPAGKCDLYDHGTAVPLVVRVPGIPGGRIVDDLVSLPDLCPTFLEVGGVPAPACLAGRSLLRVLRLGSSGQVDPDRTWVIMGRERHVDMAREGNLPYPMRALRTRDWLYIRNFAPDRWPMGSPGIATDPNPDPQLLEKQTFVAFADMDASPTKAWLILHRADPQWRPLYDHAFAKRPAEELYDLRSDPDQMKNLAANPTHAATRADLAARLTKILTQAGDPRLSADVPFEKPPFTDRVERPLPSWRNTAARRAILDFECRVTAGGTAAAARPNVVVMIVDDLGSGDVSCLTKGAVATPNLDRLAREGVTFTSGYVTAPLCAPSRAGFYTGQYPQRFGFLDNNDTLPNEIPLLPGVLKQTGYRTCLLGKWHAGGPLPHERGCFDETLCSPHPSPFINYEHPKLARNGKVQDFQEYSTDLFAREAADFIERNQAQPFALTIAFNAPHIDRVMKDADSIKTDFEAARAAGTTLDVPKHPMARPGEAARYSDRFPGDTARADTVATIAALDQAVGRILDKLQATALDRNTIVFFFADNGGHPENRSENGPLRDYKWTHFEGGIRVPFFAVYPGVFPAGLRYDEPVSTLDIFPTVTALAGIQPPAHLDGVDLTPYLKGEKQSPPHEALYFNTRNDHHAVIREGKWKLILEGGGVKLFDLSSDPGETTDLVSQEPERAAALEAKWHAWKAQMPPSQKEARNEQLNHHSATRPQANRTRHPD